MKVKEFNKKFNSDQGRGNVVISEDTNSSIYSKASLWFNSIDDHWMSNIDLYQVNLNLMNTAKHGSSYHSLHQRVMKNFTKKYCG